MDVRIFRKKLIICVVVEKSSGEVEKWLKKWVDIVLVFVIIEIVKGYTLR